MAEGPHHVCKTAQENEEQKKQLDALMKNYNDSTTGISGGVSGGVGSGVFPTYPSPCPSCGHCPTCGRRNYPSYPYYPQGPVWTLCGSGLAGQASSPSQQ